MRTQRNWASITIPIHWTQRKLIVQWKRKTQSFTRWALYFLNICLNFLFNSDRFVYEFRWVWLQLDGGQTHARRRRIVCTYWNWNWLPAQLASRITPMGDRAKTLPAAPSLPELASGRDNVEISHVLGFGCNGTAAGRSWFQLMGVTREQIEHVRPVFEWIIIIITLFLIFDSTLESNGEAFAFSFSSNDRDRVCVFSFISLYIYLQIYTTIHWLTQRGRMCDM